MKLNKYSKNERILTFALMATLLVIIGWAFIIGGSSAVASQSNSAGEGVNSNSGLPAGPQMWVGCSGNETVLIEGGNHPANTSNVLQTPLAQTYANLAHEYCENGNLVNATSGQIIPFAPPAPPTPFPSG